MKDLLLYLITSIVDQKDQVQIVEEKTPDGSLIFKVKVAKDDMGKVIGKGGKIISAVRTILKIRATKEGKMVNLELLES